MLLGCVLSFGAAPTIILSMSSAHSSRVIGAAALRLALPRQFFPSEHPLAAKFLQIDKIRISRLRRRRLIGRIYNEAWLSGNICQYFCPVSARKSTNLYASSTKSPMP